VKDVPGAIERDTYRQRLAAACCACAAEKLDPVEERVLEDLLRALLNLRILNVQESLEHYQFLLADAQTAENPDLIREYLRIVQQLSQMRRCLDQALRRFTSRSFNASGKET
jgi:hypothetical protein